MVVRDSVFNHTPSLFLGSVGPLGTLLGFFVELVVDGFFH